MRRLTVMKSSDLCVIRGSRPVTPGAVGRTSGSVRPRSAAPGARGTTWRGAQALPRTRTLRGGSQTTPRCGPCPRGRPAGASQEEAAEAIGVAILMDAGPGTVHGPRAFAAFREFHAKANQ